MIGRYRTSACRVGGYGKKCVGGTAYHTRAPVMLDATLPGDRIAKCVLDEYDRLPAKFKVHSRTDNRREWTILAGIVLAERSTTPQQDKADSDLVDQVLQDKDDDHKLNCVSLATGMKCLPRHKVATANGNILHDWHAEVLCLRGFNRWLLDECEVLLEQGHSRWLQARSKSRPTSATDSWTPSYELKNGVDIHMYISTAPCGDASMELIMNAQADATPWPKPAPSTVPGDMLGRGQFDQLGVVRRKPARPDAPITWSKSCSDKLAAKQCLSLLSSLTAGLIEPHSCYLKSLVLPQSEYVKPSFDRSFSASGRLKSVIKDEIQARWAKFGYTFVPFHHTTTNLRFCHAKTEGAVPSNSATLKTPHRSELLINGVLQGRKQSDARGASCVSRRRLAQSTLSLSQQLSSAKRVDAATGEMTYAALKAHVSQARSMVKHDLRILALSPWKTNDGDDDWTVTQP